MVVAGNDQVGFACDRVFQNSIIVVIRRNRVDSGAGKNSFRARSQTMNAERACRLFLRLIQSSQRAARPQGEFNVEGVIGS
jgi:hypothetical protein